MSSFFNEYIEKSFQVQNTVFKEINNFFIPFLSSCVIFLLFDLKNEKLKENMFQNKNNTYDFIYSFFTIINKKETPNNLLLYCPLLQPPLTKFILTMNFIDQNTQSIENMLSRRFDFKYFSYDKPKDINTCIHITDDNITLSWDNIHKELNKIILQQFHETKCIGYFFWNNFNYKEDGKISFETLKEKLIFYIFNNCSLNNNKLYYNYNIKDKNVKKIFKSISFNDNMKAKNFKELFNENFLNSCQNNLENKKNNLNIKEIGWVFDYDRK